MFWHFCHTDHAKAHARGDAASPRAAEPCYESAGALLRELHEWLRAQLLAPHLWRGLKTTVLAGKRPHLGHLRAKTAVKPAAAGRFRMHLKLRRALQRSFSVRQLLFLHQASLKSRPKESYNRLARLVRPLEPFALN